MENCFALNRSWWLPWLKKNCPGIGHRTAQKYIALANANRGSHLNQSTSLRQAYFAVGILKDLEGVKFGNSTQ